MSDRKYNGKVIWFKAKPGFGFIEWEKDGIHQKDIFVHFSGIYVEDEKKFRSLKKDQLVTFSIGKNNRDQIIAVDVRVVE
jgi:cold shock CspA family protein